MSADDLIRFGEPTISQSGDTYGFEWERNGQPCLRIQIEDVRNDGDRIMGGFTVWWLYDQPLGVRPVQPFTSLNLSSSHSTGWRSIPRELGKRIKNVDWEEALTIAVYETMERFRTGEPTVELFSGTRNDEPPFLLEPWISATGNTIIYGEGGLGKSVITLAMAISVATGVPIFGKVPHVTGPVIIFDYEDDHQTHVNRLLAICKSFGIPPEEAKVYHHALSAKVSSSHREMQRRVKEVGAVFAILDSVGMGRGGSAVAAEDTIRMFRYLREVGVPFLAIDHISKAGKVDQRKGAEADPYGSVYTTNSARLGWSLQRQEGVGEGTRIYAKNRKHNHVPKQKPQTVVFTYHNDERGVPERIDIETGNEFGMVLPAVGARERVQLLLSDGAWWTYADIAESLGTESASVRKIVSLDAQGTDPDFETKKEGRTVRVRSVNHTDSHMDSHIGLEEESE